MENSGMKELWVDVSPDLARKTLEQNTANRPIRAAVVKTYADEMKRGNWTWQAAPPVILGDGDVVIDGQHRLAAIVKSGVTVRTLVRRLAGLRDCRDIDIDIGAKRSPRDMLRKEQYQASIIRAICALSTSGKSISRRTLIACDDVYGDVVDLAASALQRGPRGVKTAGVGAGVAICAAAYEHRMSEIIESAEMMAARVMLNLPIPSFSLLYSRVVEMGGGGGGGAMMANLATITSEAIHRPDASLLRISPAAKSRLISLIKPFAIDGVTNV